MMYTNTNDERGSYSERSRNSFSSAVQGGQGNAAKRLFLLMIIMICLAFAGAQSTPTAQASAQCPLQCGPPEFDPVTGECFVTCCPADPKAKCACERQVCK